MTTVKRLIAGVGLALAIAPAPAFASGFCSDVAYVVGLKGKLEPIATGPEYSPGRVHDIPGAAEQRTTLGLAGAYRCGLGERDADGQQTYQCDFASGGQGAVADEVQSCYPNVTPTPAGEGSQDWTVAGARIEVTDYGSGANVDLTIWPPADDTGAGDDPGDWGF